jgi:hypothetical protein
MARIVKREDIESYLAAIKPNQAPEKPRKKRVRSASDIKKMIERNTDEATAFKDRNDWTQAEAKHFVAVYYKMHAFVYDALPEELHAENQWLGAVSATKKLIADSFSVQGKPCNDAVIDFIRWVWDRERRRYKQAKEQGRDHTRITWRMMFASRYYVSDYKTEKRR